MNSPQEQTGMLKSWRELVYGILYHDQCSPQYSNSTNLFAEEIDRNIQHLRTHGFDLQDQRQELTRFINNSIKPLQAHVQQTLFNLQKEAGYSDALRPAEPEGFINEGAEAYESVEYHLGQYELYQHRYKKWRVPHIEILQYQEELHHLNRNLNDIEETASGYYSMITHPPILNASTPPASDEPSSLDTTSGFDLTTRSPTSDGPPISEPCIYILPDARHSLIDAFLPYVDKSQHDSLKALINEGVSSPQPISCQCEQVKIAAIFYERVNAKYKSDRQIQADKTVLAKWIYLHFQRWENGKLKKLSESTILRSCLS